MFFTMPALIRTQMNVPCKLQKIWINFTDYGFVTVLKEMAVSFVPAVEINRVSGKEFPH